MREENLLDQLGRQLAAAAMPQHDLLVLEDRKGTRTEQHGGSTALVRRGSGQLLRLAALSAVTVHQITSSSPIAT